MTEDFTTEAFHYLLNELDPVRRAEFEIRLSRDPDARELLKSCADSVAQFACESAPAEELPRVAQRATLDAIMRAVAEEKTTSFFRFPRSKKFWKEGFWQIAAALLVGLNLFQLAHPIRSISGKGTGDSPAEMPNSVGANQASAHIRSNAQNPASSTAEARETSSKQGAGPDAEIKSELKRLETLKNEYAELERERTALRTEYEGILRQLAERAAAGKGVGHLTSMELVDPASFARGDRKGLVNLARDLLTQPGIVAVEPVNPPAKPENGTRPDKAPEPRIAPATPGTGDPLSFANTVGVLPPATFNSALPPAPPPTPPPAPSPTPPPPQSTPESSLLQGPTPYAWSLFDETEGRGYLNLYNLPTVAADQTLQLWTKASQGDTYHLVGPVPTQLYGGSGSVSYTTPGALLAPVEVLITQEPRASTPTRPSGPVILQGP